MSNVVSIQDIADHVGEEVAIQGWLYAKTGKGKLQFLQIRDGTGIIQVVMFKPNLSPEIFETGKRLSQESSLIVRGTVKQNERAPGVPGGYEIDAIDLEVIQIAEEYPITPKEHGVEFLLENRHLWIRSRLQWATLRLRATVMRAIRDWLDSRGYNNQL